MADPYFASVVLLAGNDNAASGTTTFLDQSSAAHAITRGGNTVYDNTQAAPGMSTAIKFDGTGDNLASADSADWDFGSGDFTIEAYIYFNALAGKSSWFSQDTNAAVFAPVNFAYNFSGAPNANKLELWASSTGTSWDLLNDVKGTTVFATGAWRHIALTRSGSTWTLWVDGISDGSFTASGTLFNSIRSINIGQFQGGAGGFNGWLNSLRVTKGVARYTGAFTPPSLPLPTTAVDPPVADFSGTPTSGTAPLSVAFTDLSTNTPTSWAWTFGDGNTSTSQNPTNVYAVAGTYTVGLTATNAAGSDVKTKTGYITVTAASTDQARGQVPLLYSGHEARARTEQEVRKDRERFGLVPKEAEVIEALAKNQAEQLALTENDRLAQLKAKLKLENIEYRTNLLDALNEQREKLINDELASILKSIQQQREIETLILLAAQA